jgi:MarR family transcriptional regulator for hemolysin
MPATSVEPGAQESFGALLADVLRLLRSDFLRRARTPSLPPQLHRLLLAAHRHPGCRQVELAAWLDLSPVTVGRMLDRLERQGLLRREQHPTDRRATVVHVERKALPQVRRLAGFARRTLDRAFTGMTPTERQVLLTGLQKVRMNLSGARGTGTGRRTHGR